MDDQIRRYEEDRLRREKLAYFQAARNDRERRGQEQAAQQTVELGGLIALGIVGAVGGVLWGLLGTKIGRVITLLLLLAGGTLFGLYWLQNDAAVRAQAQRTQQPQNIATPQAGVDTSSGSEKAAQQLAATNIGPDAAASPATSGLDTAVLAANTLASETAIAVSGQAGSSDLASAAPVPSLAASAPTEGTAVRSDVGIVAAASASVVVPIVASFDCAKAASDIEKLICSSPETADSDRRLAAAYAAARSKASDQTALKQGQRAWMKQERDVCTDAACLLRVTDARIQTLAGI
ncbi:hypothetical protein AYM40_17110 [Paraburkholderia phytofirmans OLGA172]|uniref:Lysozyme inhibitor LprI-like N-terminal domain-containing protein n=1 Tax=Paraburkholderia phytofirmans OLGA172 TaxID=1417228 RepID=A0A160FMY7_9BURK|nr:lysozyme inhibitor LprI family protein [Paraburkholderia phytofirmans]ANB73892.1 hypothetical protein AYM40_17110 [Paraburkholderia phytofirmans OLGA172]